VVDASAAFFALHDGPPMRTLDTTLASGIWRDLVAEHGTPLVIVDAAIIRERCRALKSAFPGARFFYAPKANYNPWIVRLIVGEGFGIDAVSPMEIELALRLGVAPENITYVENAMSPDDLAYAVQTGVPIVLGSLGALERYGAVRRGASVGIRVNGEVGASEHQYTYTSGPRSKFGIHPSQFGEAKAIADGRGIRITRLHQHIGSNWLDSAPFLAAAKSLCELAASFPDLKTLDFGGGFGVPYHEEQHPLDVAALGNAFGQMIGGYHAAAGRRFEIAFEPGRYVVAESSAIVTRVNDRKTSGSGRVFVATDTGFNHLIRPALYGSRHRILNLSSPDAAPETVDVCGNLCEEADYLARDRSLPRAEEGDFLAVMDVGAYGLSMGSDYNLRPLPPEILIDGNERKLIRHRRGFAELMRQFDF
jgi:diaminopimelate decarboxylase